MSEAAEGVDPSLILLLFEATPQLHDGRWPRLARPLFDVNGFVAVVGGARDRLSPSLEAALRIGLVRAGLLDPREVSSPEVHAAAAAALVEAASGDAGPDVLREGVAFGADRWRRALLDRLASPDARERLSEASARWLLEGVTSPTERVLCKLLARDEEGAPAPLAIEGAAERASLDELVSRAAELSDEVAFAALVALDARGFADAPPSWEDLLRPSHVGRRKDFGEAPVELASALRRASVETRLRLLAAQSTFPWLVASAFRGVPGALARAKRERALALPRGAAARRRVEPHEVYEIERGVASLTRRPSRRSRPARDGLPAQLVAAIDAALDALDADAFAQVPRGLSSRVFHCLSGGEPSWFLMNEKLEARLEAGAPIDGDDVGLLASTWTAGGGAVAAQWRSRVQRLIELRAPEPVLAREISSLRLAERSPRAAHASTVFAYPGDAARSRGLLRQLHLSVLVGERVVREVAPRSKLSRIAPQLLADLVRLRDGRGRAHADLGDVVEDFTPDGPSSRKSWAACAYLYVQAEHFTGNPRCTIQDTPLDLAQQAYMPKGFWRREGHAERRRFWAWLLLVAVPSAYRRPR